MEEHNVLHETFFIINNYHVNFLKQEKFGEGGGRHTEL